MHAQTRYSACTPPRSIGAGSRHTGNGDNLDRACGGVQAFIPETGKGVQGATSHCLGQNFSRMFDITFVDAQRQERHAWQTSWGCTTRTLGVLVMTHGDDRGLVIPPRVASKQAVVIPITMASLSDEAKAALDSKARELAATLTAAGAPLLPLRRHCCHADNSAR